MRPSTSVLHAAVLLVAGAALAAVASAEASTSEISTHSFKPPYTSYDFEGKRQIPGYSYGGNVEVNENFIRLTPDRAVRALGRS